MGVTRGMDEVARAESRHLCHHLQQQGIGGNVERHTQEGVCRALIELQRQTALCILSVGIVDIELEDGVAWRQRHFVDLCHVPCRDNHAARVGVGLQLVYHILYLVNDTSVVVGPRAPLVTIDGSQLAVLVGPFVPDVDIVLLQVLDVGATLQKP